MCRVFDYTMLTIQVGGLNLWFERILGPFAEFVSQCGGAQSCVRASHHKRCLSLSHCLPLPSVPVPNL